jgi:chromosome partitioning protein
MIRVVVSNQRGGVGKTTTALTFARFLADAGKRVLLIDTDPQGSVEAALGLKAQRHLAHFVAHKYALSECIVPAHDRIDVLCSNRETLQAESALMGAQAREVILAHLLAPFERDYEAVLIDVAPSISMLQTCAMVYAKNVLIPLDMDSLSLTGAGASVTAITQLNQFINVGVRAVGLLPTKVDRRMQMTQIVLSALKAFGERYEIPVLNEIRTDATVPKATRSRKFLADFDPECKAMQDYRVACQQIFDSLSKGTDSDGKAPAQA